MKITGTLAIAACLLGFAAPAGAEVDEVRIARQYGVGFLPLMIMERDGLVEKHAKAAGVTVQANWTNVAGPSVMNDGLISESLHFAGQGISSLFTLWDRTRSNVGIKAVAAVGAWPLYLITTNPDVKTIRDLSSKDKIAVPSIKVSLQAITLQMAAAKEFGKDQYARFDPYTVSLSHPDAVLALTNNTAGVNGHFSSSPFFEQEMRLPNVRLVTTSWDILGAPQTSVVVTATSKFRDANPKITQAFVQALAEGVETVNRDRRAAAEYYLQATRGKQSVDEILATMESTRYSTKPENIMITARFMADVGMIKQAPASIGELFFPEAGELRD